MKKALYIIFLSTCVGCVRTEVINEVLPMPTRTKQQDTIIVTPPADTARLPITFDPSVDDWDEKDVEEDV